MLCRYWQSWPSEVWLLCAAVQHISFVSYRSIFVHEIGVTSWLTLWRRWLHIYRLFILKVEYGFVHRGDDKLWDTLFVLIQLFHGRVLGAQPFTYLSPSHTGLFDRTIVGDLARLRLVSKFFYDLRLLLRLVVQLVVRFHRLIPREVIGSRMTRVRIATTDCTTNRRSPRLVARPIADRHDWLHDQSQIATTGGTTNRRLPRLVARPTAGCHDWWHDQPQVATTGGTTNRRSAGLVARPIADRHYWLHDQSQIATTGCTTNRR